MGFIGVYTAVYDYQPQAEGELEIREGDLLYVLEKSTEDDWWKAKKKAEPEDDEEPVGLVPSNYVQEARPIDKAKALYDYTRQTDEEVSFSEETEIVVYDTSDPDWTLVSVNSDFGFAPSNYIELLGVVTPAATPDTPNTPEEPAAPPLPQRPQGASLDTDAAGDATRDADADADDYPSASVPATASVLSPAAAIAGIIHKQHGSLSSHDTSAPIPTIPVQASQAAPATALAGFEDEESSPPPSLPQRPESQQTTSPVRRPPPRDPSPRPRSQVVVARERNTGVHESSPHLRFHDPTPSPRSPSGYHIYNISEMVSVMGKKKKMPTSLGINIATGTIFISPEDSDDTGNQEWTADKLTHYSIEGKHIFLELVRPSRSFDLHAGAKDTAQEIVSALGEIAGGYRAEGLREVIAAGQSGQVQKKGQVLYEFMAQGDDEVTVAVGDEVIILDDSKSEDWWMVRALKNGHEGVVPSCYIEITGITSAPLSTTGINAGRSTISKNRLEEERLAKEAVQKPRDPGSHNTRVAEVGPGVKLPERRSSLMALNDNNIRSQHHRRERSDRGTASSRTKPDPAKTKQWTDRSGSFNVEAQFIGLHGGKIHLHKTNGIKIAVPIAKMSLEDLEFVEKVTGESLDEDKPLSDIQRRSRMELDKSRPRAPSDPTRSGLQKAPQPDYDWFDFFLKAGVGPHQCERYAQSFTKDSMDEGVLPDITPETLHRLGMKEGDILRVMRHLDNRFNRTGAKSKPRNVSFGGEEVISQDETNPPSGGLFSGPGGALRNNTRKGRPAPAVQTGDVIDPKAFEQRDNPKTTLEPKETPPAARPTSSEPIQSGFDDDAWAVKPPKQQTTSATATSPTAPAPPTKVEPPKSNSLTGAMADLSLLQPPLQPTPAPPSQPSQTFAPAPAPVATTLQPPSVTVAPQQQPQMTGANPNFFAQLGRPGQQVNPQAISPQGQSSFQGFTSTSIGLPQTTFQQSMPPRQRPQPPQNIAQNSLLPPPLQRPLSAPQNVSAFGPPPLQPQLTGIPPQIAPPGQSLIELTQPRLQLQLQPTGFSPQFQNLPQPTGFNTFSAPQQPMQTGVNPMFPTSQALQHPTLTGINSTLSSASQQPMLTGINSLLPPPLPPQRTGINGFEHPTITTIPPVPPIPQQLAIAPLQPQKTGPPPPVRFGVHKEPRGTAPQPTGLKANLAQATPTNPFGF